MGSIPGLGTFTCPQVAAKKKKKTHQITPTGLVNFLSFDFLGVCAEKLATYIAPWFMAATGQVIHRRHEGPLEQMLIWKTPLLVFLTPLPSDL